MIKTATLTKYSPEIAQRVRELLIALSRSGTDKGEIPEEWFEEIIASPSHDLLLAYDESGKVIGMASLSLILGPGIQKNAYLEDFVTDPARRNQGIGSTLWTAILDWSRTHGTHRLEFTCGSDRTAAQSFYHHHGAKIYDTNFLRVDL